MPLKTKPEPAQFKVRKVSWTKTQKIEPITKIKPHVPEQSIEKTIVPKVQVPSKSALSIVNK